MKLFENALLCHCPIDLAFIIFFLRIVNPLKHSIYKVLISNIPYSASVQNITNIIGSISHVVKAEFKAELLISKSGSILVSFDSEDDAVQAVDSINEMQFEGNKISCIIQQNKSNKKSIQNVPTFTKFSK